MIRGNMTGKHRLAEQAVRRHQATRAEANSFTARFTKWAQQQTGNTLIAGCEIIGRGRKQNTEVQSANMLKRTLGKK